MVVVDVEYWRTGVGRVCFNKHNFSYKIHINSKKKKQKRKQCKKKKVTFRVDVTTLQGGIRGSLMSRAHNKIS